MCGTLDYLGWHKEKQELWVLDYKTSKKIGTDQDSTWRRMLGPFVDLWDNELNVYSLQISLYRLMLEAQFIPTAGGAICWLPSGNTILISAPMPWTRRRISAKSLGQLNVP